MTNPLPALNVSDIVLRRDGTEILRGASAHDAALMKSGGIMASVASLMRS